MKRFILFILFAIPFLVIAKNVFAQEGVPGTPIPEFPAAVASIIGALAPMIIQFVNKRVTGKEARFWTAVGLSIVTAIVGALVAGVELTDPMGLAVFTVWVFTFSQFTWHAFWEKLLKKENA